MTSAPASPTQSVAESVAVSVAESVAQRARRSAIVVGGGPGGLMAAEVLATAGWSVSVHDHMPLVGRKFLLAGRGGLNITHSEPIDEMLPRYGRAAARLETALRAFGPNELRAWCLGLGEPTVIGTSGRVFPASFRATPLLRAWLRRLDELGVQIEVRDRWVGWNPADDAIDAIDTMRFVRHGGAVHDEPYDAAVLALGGASWPRVGSDGGWAELVRAAGIDVRPLRPSNVGIRVGWSAAMAERFAGAPLKNVTVAVQSSRHAAVRGDAMVTASGLEGGPIYALTVPIREALDRNGTATLVIDLCPDLDPAAAAARLGRRRTKDSMATALRRSLGLAPVAIALLREATGNRIPTDRDELARLVRAVPITVVATMPIGRAISTAGGIDLDEVDDHFMLRRRPGTFVVGEMLDWEAPTGGYLLQATFSSAVAAARGAQTWAGASG